jgi:hypothetical protein
MALKLVYVKSAKSSESRRSNLQLKGALANCSRMGAMRGGEQTREVKPTTSFK